MDRLEVVLLEVLSDLLAEHRSLRIGRAEVDAGPHSSIDDLLERVGEPLKAPRRTGFVAAGAEGDFRGRSLGDGESMAGALPNVK